MMVALLASPKGFSGTLKPLPSGVSFTARPDAGAGLFICFSKSAAELQAHIARGITAWPIGKRCGWSGRRRPPGVTSDLDGNIVRNTGLAAGWVDYKVCSVDDTWSALAFKRRK